MGGGFRGEARVKHCPGAAGNLGPQLTLIFRDTFDAGAFRVAEAGFGNLSGKTIFFMFPPFQAEKATYS